MPEKVYVSATFDDLKNIRSAVRDKLKRLNLDDVAMEYYCAEETRHLEKCLGDIRECDLFIGIIAYRYGHIFKGETKSITELEYEEAGNKGIERHMFVLDDPLWPRSLTDHSTGDNERGVLIDDFRMRLLDLRARTFNNKDELLGLISDSILKWKNDRQNVKKPSQPESPVQKYLEKIKSTYTNNKFEKYYVHLSGGTHITEIKDRDDCSDFLWPSYVNTMEQIAPQIPKAISLLQVENAVAFHRQFVIVGRPGCGKTAVLKHILNDTAHRYLAGTTTSIPLFIELQAWPDNVIDLATLIHNETLNQIGTPVFPESLLLLLDGLSQMDSEYAAIQIESIAVWLSRHPGTSVVITSREETGHLGLPIVNVLPMNDKAVEKFVLERLGDRNKGLLHEIGWECRLDAAPRDLVHMARNPFLLQVMCLIYNKDERIPPTRGELIRSFASELYDREQKQLRKEMRYHQLSTAIDGFGALAVAMLHNRTSQMVETKYIERYLPNGIDGNALVRLGRGADFIVLVKEGRFLKFAHPLLLEYFAAEYYLTHSEQLGALIREPLIENGRRILRPYDEVIYTLLNLGNPSSMLLDIVERDPFLAAAAISQSPNEYSIDCRILAQLLNRFISLIQGGSQNCPAALSGMVQLGNMIVSQLLLLQKSNLHWMRRIALTALSQIPGRDALEGVINSLLDSNRWIRRDAQNALQSLDKESRPLMIAFIERLSKMEPGLRKQLSRALIECWRGIDDELVELVSINADIPINELFRTVEPTYCMSEDDGIDEQTSEELGKWGLTWRQSWNGNPGEQGLETSGRRWLKGGPREHPAWGLVWTALWAWKPGDSDLEAIGRRWLAEQPVTNGSWTYLWVALWVQHPGNSELEQMGRNWINNVPAGHQAWTLIWRYLWQVDPKDPDLERLGIQWLQQNVLQFEHFWGVIWLSLWEVNVGDCVLAEQGRRWLEIAKPDHIGWGYIWPKLWEADPGNSVLQTMAREWLGHVKIVQVNFNFIWGPLFKSNPADIGLKDLGFKLLNEITAKNDSWGYIWKALAESSDADEELISRGQSWLKIAALENKSWAAVWITLWNKKRGDSVLLEQAINWIENAPASQAGWHTIWMQLRKFCKNDGRIDRIGLNWLSVAPPFHGGWSYVWMELHTASPGDNGLIIIGRTWLDRVPILHRGWSQIWQVIYATSPFDEQLKQKGFVWLKRARLEDKHWPYVWRTLWNRTPGDQNLENEARSWLASSITQRPGWGYVWTVLFTYFPRDRQLFQLGLEWLDNAASCSYKVASGDMQWIQLWKRLSEGDCWDTDLLATTERYLRFYMIFDNNWLDVWSRLAGTGKMPDDIMEAGRKRGFAYLAESSPTEEEALINRIETAPIEENDNWTFLWRQAWDADIERPRLACFAINAIEKAGWIKQLPFIWKDIFDEIGPDEGLMRIGKVWVTGVDSSSPGWGLVWNAMVRARKSDSELLKLGRRWMQHGFFTRSSWPKIWLALWDLDVENHSKLVRHAKEWIYSNLKEDDAVLPVWRAVWAVDSNDENLLRWGINFLALNSKYHEWSEIVLDLWTAQNSRPTLRRMVLSWIKENRQHPKKDTLKRLINVDKAESQAQNENLGI